MNKNAPEGIEESMNNDENNVNTSINKNIDGKIEQLNKALKSYGKIALAYSGGVDSTFLLEAAVRVLGKENVMAVTVFSAVNPAGEEAEAVEFAKSLGVLQKTIEADVFSIPHFAENPSERCYYCKKEIFGSVKKAAKENGFEYITDGTNTDDDGDYRPGMKAVKELEVKSPLREAGFGKKEIREYSKQWGLYTSERPSMACLASRIPYGEEITLEKLKITEQAEMAIRALGFKQIRVRNHGTIARVEISPEEISKALNLEMMSKMDEIIKKNGFLYATLDMRGYRTGSMNEVLKQK